MVRFFSIAGNKTKQKGIFLTSPGITDEIQLVLQLAGRDRYVETGPCSQYSHLASLLDVFCRSFLL